MNPPAHGTPSRSSTSPLPSEAVVAGASVVIVPGFMCGQEQYKEMAQSLASRGVRVAVVPLEWYDWFPTVATNSMRHVLDAIDHTVRHLAAQPAERGGGPGGISMSTAAAAELIVPVPRMSAVSLVDEWIGRAVGGVGGHFALEAPAGGEAGGEEGGEAGEARVGQVALVAHSAGGWLSRLYLSDKEHYGRVYRGSTLVHSLITLGSPHKASAVTAM